VDRILLRLGVSMTSAKGRAVTAAAYFKQLVVVVGSRRRFKFSAFNDPGRTRTGVNTAH